LEARQADARGLVEGKSRQFLTTSIWVASYHMTRMQWWQIAGAGNLLRLEATPAFDIGRAFRRVGTMSNAPTAAELPKAYEPQAVEEKWYRRWLDEGCFRADESSPREGYAIVIPPPNVTGVLHLGHVLNNTLQDILARRARQLGKEVLWLPGCDHAGIATQTRVEREIRATEKRTRHDLGREAFLERVWAWKEKHGSIIFEQLRRLGCSCDWGRERFTMDADYSHWVQHVFCDLFNKGLIHRGRRMVNWCPVSLTALSDEEVIMKPQRGRLFTMRYELADEPGRWLLVSTTRPETLMADTAVAVHPDDERYRDLVGRMVLRPFPRAPIPVIADCHVEKEFGTGALKVTPAHDKADFEIGQRHGLPVIDVLTPDGRIDCPAVPGLHGLERFAARKLAAQMLADLGLLEKEEDYENNVGFSERADVPVEPRLSMQWFLRYPAVAETAAAVASDRIRFRPERWKKTFAHWMENLQDWCISRQLWWGHRIPVWYRKDRAADLREAASLGREAVAAGDLHVGTEPPPDPDNWVQDGDVLDTWFSSWLWPFATMTKVGERSPTLAKFYPTGDLVTGPDIIFFWVARMIMAGFEYEGREPFANVYFTSIIRDLKGRKMSKSLGNSPEPLDLVAKYGADGLRFGLLRIAPAGQDVRFDEKQIEEGRNFANKLWNACRFRQLAGPPPATSAAARSPFETDILAKLDTLQAELDAAYAERQFNTIAQKLYDFFWGDYCDLFLEAVKGDLRDGADPARRTSVLATIDTVLPRFLQFLHPYMPHITEELWEKMGFGDGRPLMLAALPVAPVLPDPGAPEIAAACRRAAAVFQTASSARRLKADNNLASSRNVRFELVPGPACNPADLPALAVLAGAAEIAVVAQLPEQAPKALTELGELALPLAGLIDLAAERQRLAREIDRVAAEIAKCEAKLANPAFADRAPPPVVDQERRRLTEWQEKHARLGEMLAGLG
jgi:valyl-tRNA synthetase